MVPPFTPTNTLEEAAKRYIMTTNCEAIVLTKDDSGNWRLTGDNSSIGHLTLRSGLEPTPVEKLKMELKNKVDVPMCMWGTWLIRSKLILGYTQKPK